jgi:hypothetical protein
VLSGQGVVTLTAAAFEHTQTVAATGVTPASRVFASVAPHSNDDENDPELLDVLALSAAPGAGTVEFTLAFGTPTRGPVKINWSAF